MEVEYDPVSVADKSKQFIVLSGCSGGGKSSLLAELGRRGYAIYEEPGRQVVKEQLMIGGDALPWGNLDLFLELTISRSIHHLVEAARGDSIALFDRGIVDQVSGYCNRAGWNPETFPSRCRTFSLSRDGVRRAAMARDFCERCGAPAQLRGFGRDV